MNNNANNPGSLGRNENLGDPFAALNGALDALTSVYEEAGVSFEAARSAALADFVCDFGIIPVAA